jgi:hypothetical protein
MNPLIILLTGVVFWIPTGTVLFWFGRLLGREEGRKEMALAYKSAGEAMRKLQGAPQQGRGGDHGA